MKFSLHQLEDMHADRKRSADQHLHEYARQRLPETTEPMEDAALQSQINEMRKIADPLHISERDAAFLLDLVLLYGADFDQEEWADILSDNRMIGTTRVSLLRERTQSAIEGD
jgi:hypothetical protein